MSATRAHEWPRWRIHTVVHTVVLNAITSATTAGADSLTAETLVPAASRATRPALPRASSRRPWQRPSRRSAGRSDERIRPPAERLPVEILALASCPAARRPTRARAGRLSRVPQAEGQRQRAGRPPCSASEPRVDSRWQRGLPRGRERSGAYQLRSGEGDGSVIGEAAPGGPLHSVRCARGGALGKLPRSPQRPG